MQLNVFFFECKSPRQLLVMFPNHSYDHDTTLCPRWLALPLLSRAARNALGCIIVFFAAKNPTYTCFVRFVSYRFIAFSGTPNPHPRLLLRLHARGTPRNEIPGASAKHSRNIHLTSMTPCTSPTQNMHNVKKQCPHNKCIVPSRLPLVSMPPTPPRFLASMHAPRHATPPAQTKRNHNRNSTSTTSCESPIPRKSCASFAS